MRRAPATCLVSTVLVVLLSGCNGDATTKNDVTPGPTENAPSAPLSPGARTPGTQTPSG